MNASRDSLPINGFLKAWRAENFDYGMDRFFYRPAARWRFLEARKLADGPAAIASDHEPVIQEMELLVSGVSLLPGKTGEAARPAVPSLRSADKIHRQIGRLPKFIRKYPA